MLNKQKKNDFYFGYWCCTSAISIAVKMTPNYDDSQLGRIARVAVFFLAFTMLKDLRKDLLKFLFKTIPLIDRHYLFLMTEQKEQMPSIIKDIKEVGEVNNFFRNAYQKSINWQNLHLGGICLLLVLFINAVFICVDTVYFCVNTEYDYLNLNKCVIVNVVIMVCIVVVVGLYCWLFNKDMWAKFREKDVKGILDSVNTILSNPDDMALEEWRDPKTTTIHPAPSTMRLIQKGRIPDGSLDCGILLNTGIIYPNRPVHITDTTISLLVELYETKIYDPSTKPIRDRLSWLVY